MFRPLLVLLAFIPPMLLAQMPSKTSDFAVSGSIGIPSTISSRMFRTAFNGVYQFNVIGSARVFKNVSIGLGFQNTHFQNNKRVFAFKTFTAPNGTATGNVLSFNTRLNCYGFFMRVGYEKYLEKTFVRYSLNAGYMMNEYQNLNGDTTGLNKPLTGRTFSTPYLEPEVSINFLTDGRLTISLFLSYGTMLKKFDPKAPQFGNIGEVAEKKNNYLMSWINLGFGFNIRIGD